MRTKTLLLTAVLGAAGVLSSMAQVYSVNAVGYVNLDLPAGFSLVANPLNNGANKLGTVIPTAPDSSVIYRWSGVGFDTDPPNYVDGLGWLTSVGVVNDTYVLAPGEGVFISLPSAKKLTFVGEVPQGNLSSPIPMNYSILASQVPQAGTLTQLGFPAVADDVVYQWKKDTQSYETNPPQFIDTTIGWLPAEPTLAVGESFFLLRTTPNSAGNWTRTFSVNN